eukprot:5787882-Ditylum_brightwellii.AAC.1
MMKDRALTDYLSQQDQNQQQGVKDSNIPPEPHASNVCHTREEEEENNNNGLNNTNELSTSYLSLSHNNHLISKCMN